MERERLKAEAGSNAMEEIEDTTDDVPEITKRHFEEAMRDARRSVSDADLMKYSSFAQTLRQQRATIGGTGVDNFRFPERQSAAPAAAEGGAPATSSTEDDDEDIYN